MNITGTRARGRERGGEREGRSERKGSVRLCEMDSKGTVCEKEKGREGTEERGGLGEERVVLHGGQPSVNTEVVGRKTKKQRRRRKEKQK